MELKGRRIVVCATGSVAAIETPKLARELRRQGAEVYCVMSQAAQGIIHPDVLEWASDHEVVTKLDGSGKGGIVVAIQDELGIPTRFFGTGEKLDDFAPFERKTYLENLL